MKFFERVRVGTTTTGTGAIDIGAAVGPNFLDFAEAGAADADVTVIVIEDGSNFAVEYGTITDTVTKITRGTVLYSKIGGTAGTSRLSLTGAAEVKGGVSADELNAIVQRQLAAAASKSTPVGADRIAIVDSADADDVKLLSFTSLAAWIATLLSPSPPQGRLTLTSATPVTSGDVTAAGTVYYTPQRGNRIPIYNGSYFAMREFAELSQAATDTTKSPAATAADKNYDMFVWDDAGTLRLSRGPAWTTDTSRATFITSVGGVMVNAAGITNGPATERGTWVGTIRSTGASQFEDSAVKRFVWNAYNRVIKNLKRLESTDSWSYSTATLRQANNSSANQVAFVTGAAEDTIEITAQATFLNSTSTERNGTVSIGLDSTSSTAADATPARFGGTNAGVSATSAKYAGTPTPGYHFLAWLEAGAGVDTQTWHGDNGQPSLQQNGMLGRFAA